MRIATYNIWNERTFWDRRFPAVCAEVIRVDADVIALQEVPMKGDLLGHGDAAHALASQCGYPYVVVYCYPEDDTEGLAYLSKHPITPIAPMEVSHPAIGCACGLRITVDHPALPVAITTVHLDWASIGRRETQIIEILAWIEATAQEGRAEVLCGDFNCPPESSVYRFLMGQQTLINRSTPPWIDLAVYYGYHANTPPLPTLNFTQNPRWQTSHTLELPRRVDWLLIRPDAEQPYPSVLRSEIFGVIPITDAHIVPSDHYGVLADLQIG